MINKIVLATVNSRAQIYTATSGSLAAIAPNVPMALLTAYVRAQGIAVVQIDADRDNVSDEVLLDIINKEHPLLVGIICAGGINGSSSTMYMDRVISFFSVVLASKISINKISCITKIVFTSSGTPPFEKVFSKFSSARSASFTE